MKKILVPIDFSRLSNNALNYAAEVAKHTQAQLMLFHVCFAPALVASNAAAVLPSAEELRNDGLKDLEKIKRKLEKKYGTTLVISCYCVNGFPVDEIRLFAAKFRADLIVAGTQGAGYLSERFLGSTATALIKHAPCPVLAIDKHLKFKSLKRIVLACDFVETKKQVLKPVKDLCKAFKASIYILNIVKDPVVAPSLSEVLNSYKLDQSLKNIHHTFFYMHREDVVDGINEFVTDHKMDMIVMIPRKHSFFSRLLTEPQTKRMAFHAKVPLLTLHDQ